MSIYRSGRKARKWARFAMKWGLILTDVALWEAVAEDVRGAAGSVTDRVKRKYEGRSAREEEEQMRAAMRGGPDWFGRTTSLVAGIGIGVGLGLLFAPTSGQEAREAIRDKAVEMKERVASAAARTMPFGSPDTATGTHGD